MADLEEIMAGRSASAPDAEPTPTHEQTPPAADPNEGRPQGQEQQPGPNADPNPNPDPNPDDDTDPVTGLRKALDAERGKGRKYKETVEQFERRLEEMQQQFQGFIQAIQPVLQQRAPQAPQAEQPKQPVDFWENPDGFVDARLTQTLDPLQNEVLQTREFFSRRLAEKDHGPEKVNEAYSALDAAIRRGELDGEAVKSKLLRSMDPYGEIMAWYEQRPEAQRERLEAEILAKYGIQPGQQPPQARAPQQQPQAPAQSMPTSFAGARSSGPRTAPQWSGPKPLSELMGR